MDWYWSPPGGIVEGGELLTEALGREVREETGLEIVDPGRLIYVVNFHNPNPQQIREHLGPGTGYTLVTHVFEVAEFKGLPAPIDPDGLVTEARFLPIAHAIVELEKLPPGMGFPVIAYLRGEERPGALYAYRRRTDGRDELVAHLAGTG